LIPDDGVFVIGADGVLTEEELYHTLKVLNLNRAEFEDHREKEGWSDDTEEEENMTFGKYLFKSLGKFATLFLSVPA
jgi:hypothetical protein